MNTHDVVLTTFNKSWLTKFEIERELIANTIKCEKNKIIHFGSTSIPGSYCKPIIDIAIVVCNLKVGIDNIYKMRRSGYNYRIHILPDRICLTKGSPKEFNTYFIQENSGTLGNWLKVKHILTNNPDLLSEYNNLKIELVKSGKRNIATYTNGKSDFILKILKNE